MLAHQDDRVQVMHEISTRVGMLAEGLPEYLRMATGRCEHREGRRREKGVEKQPGFPSSPGSPEDAGVRRNAQELVTDPPGQKPRGHLPAPHLEELTARRMEFRCLVGCVEKNVRVGQEHLPAFHDTVELVPVGHIHTGPSAVPAGQLRQGCFPRLAFVQEPAQGGLDEFGHGPPLTCRLFPKPLHHLVIDVQRRLHMDNHTGDMATRQTARHRACPTGGARPSGRGAYSGEAPAAAAARWSASAMRALTTPRRARSAECARIRADSWGEWNPVEFSASIKSQRS